MKHPLLVTFVFLLVAGSMSAQAYITAAGMRFGDGVGLSLQQRIAKKSTLEATLHGPLGDDVITFTGLYERHLNILTRHLNIYGGIGAYKTWAQDTQLETFEDPFGLAFVGGAEMTIGRVNFSLDVRPTIQLSNLSDFNTNAAVGVSVRYVLIKDGLFSSSKKRKRKRQKRKKKRDNDVLFRG